MVLLITPGFPANEGDDICVPYLQPLVRRLVEQGVPVRVLALEYPFHTNPYSWHGVQVYPCGGKNSRWRKWLTFVRALLLIKRWIRDGEIQVIHSFWLGQAWYIGRFAALKTHIPHWTTFMGQDVLQSHNFFWLRRFTAADAARSVTLSNFHAQQLIKSTGMASVGIIPMGIDLLENRAFSQAKLAYPHPKSEMLVLGVGSLLAVKDWPRWLRIIGLAAAKNPQLRARLIGYGPEQARIEAAIAAMGLQNRVELIAGMMPRDTVLQNMLEADIFLHTSRFESYGYVLAEADACGCPVVSTPVGCAPDFAFCADDDQQLADLLLTHIGKRKPLLPFLIEDTVAAYRRLWSI